MFNYLAFLWGGLTSASTKAFADGEALANECVDKWEKIDNPEQFPPSLLILLASPAYLEQPKAAQLVAGVQQAFTRKFKKETPLVGSSVAAVFFDQKIHERGALLVCLASRLVEAKVGVGPNACENPDSALVALVNDLELESAKSEDANPFGDRMLLAFFPRGDKGLSTEELHKRLSEAVLHRIAIVGGVSSANDPDRTIPGLQFAGHDVYRGALAAARITCGCPLGTSLGMGLSATGRFVHIKRISEDKKRIEEFDESLPEQALKEEEGLALFGQRTRDHDLIMAHRRPGAGNQPIQLLRQIEENWPLEIFKPAPEKMRSATVQAVQLSLQRFAMENPVACLALACASHYRYRDEIGLDIEAGLKEIERTVKNHACVGGFVDGEAGTDKSGRSIFTNWSVGAIAFGDEMRARTPSQRGFAALAQHSPALNKAASTEEAIKESVQLVYDAGFPGAMISLVLRDRDRNLIVARDAIGSRFKKVLEMTRRRLEGDDILAIVAREKEPEFISDSRTAPTTDKPSIQKSRIISQFVMPLRGIGGEVLATLEVDLGDASYKYRLHKTEEQVLQSLGAAIGECLRRVYNWEEARIAAALDKALVDGLSAASVEEGLQRFIEAVVRTYGADMGHVRLANREKHCLTMAAGCGPYYDVARQVRADIDFVDRSPTSLAFLGGSVMVVNDAGSDTASAALCARFDRDAPVRKALEEGASYASVPFSNERGEPVGTINIASRQPWFFTWPHVHSLDAVAQRAGILVEHLRRKQREEEGRKRLTFLLEVGPQLAKTPDFRDSRTVLKEATARFCRAANAEVASLYLWDNELNKYVLRAQEGWVDPAWVDAARYGKGEGWTGSMAMIDRPRYVSNLGALKGEALGVTTARYMVQMFGSALPEELTLEAIALPLEIADERLGVLTLYRRVLRSRPWRTSGFVTTDPNVLQEAADHMAGLVSALKSFQATLWEQQERERREEVYAVLIQPDHGGVLEDRLCRQVVASFRASRAVLYLPKEENKGSELTEAAAYSVEPEDGIAGWSHPDDLVSKALSSGQVEVGRKSVTDEQRRDPRLAALEGLVNRACIPIRSEKRPYGVLDLHWRLPRGPADPFLTRHDSNHLQILGDTVGSAYHRHKLIKERQEGRARAQKSQGAAQAMAAMLFQTGHRLMNLVQDLRAVPALLRHATSEPDKLERIAQMEGLIKEGTAQIDRPMEIASRMTRDVRISTRLGELLEEVVNDCRNPHPDRIHVSVSVPKGISIEVDPDQIREAFRNLVENAYRFMPKGGVLAISATINECDRRAVIVFKDTGVGMTQDEKQAALNGFFFKEGHRGVGVLISRLLVESHGGNLVIESKKGQGSSIVITLPL